MSKFKVANLQGIYNHKWKDNGIKMVATILVVTVGYNFVVMSCYPVDTCQIIFQNLYPTSCKGTIANSNIRSSITKFSF